jgi:hypothetical protein
MRAALALAFAAIATPAAAHWEYTRWGMTQQQVIAASRGAVRALPANERRRVPAARIEYRASGEFRAGTLRLTAAFAFDTRNGGLVCVSARGDASQGPALRARIERAFGAPAERGVDPASGTATFAWTQPDEINLELAPGQPVMLLQCSRGV